MTQSQGKHVLVIGGGIIGTCTAYSLKSLGPSELKVTVLEGSSVAAGASGKAGGLLAVDWHGPSTSSLAALSYRTHAELANKYNGKDRWGYRQLDTLSVSADLSSSGQPKDVRTTRRPVKSAHLFNWLSADALRDSSVLGNRDSTAQVHPRLFTEALMQEAQELGVQLYPGTATSLERHPDGSFKVRVDADSESEIEATDLVICAGPWTGKLLKQFGLDKGAGRARSITGSRAHSIVVRPKAGLILPAQALFTSIKERSGHSEPEIYNRPDGTAYCCGATDSAPLPGKASDVTVSDGAIATIAGQVAQLAPEYLAVEGGGATIEAKQACYLPVGSAGGDPVIGKLVGEEHVFVGAGHSCWGIQNGPGTGIVLAEIILHGEANSADVRALKP